MIIINRFMKYERILLLLGYPWAIFIQNLGGWVNTLEVNFFFWTVVFFWKNCHFCPFIQIMKTSFPVHNSIHNAIHIFRTRFVNAPIVL